LVIWEGVTQSLPEEAVDATLRTLATMHPGSEVVFTYVDRALIQGTRSFPGGRRLLFAVRMLGEPFRFGLAPAEAAGFLRDRGFELLEDIGGAEFTARYFTPLDRTDRATETERGEIRDRGVRPITVDVSEFLKKGGGSVKCMIGDLGVVSER
jgi:O-methyltransferase involved in polyketide biosynthesis